VNKIALKAKAGATIYASTGMIGYAQADRMSTLHFYKACKGSVIRLLNRDYMFNVATYSLSFSDEYIYSYTYQQNQCWATYNNDLNGGSYRQEDYIFTDERLFRICLKRCDGGSFTAAEAESINNIIEFFSSEAQQKHAVKACFEEEIKITANAINNKRTAKSLVLAVLTDTHYTVNGTWQDTAENIRQVHGKARLDGIVHLGDLTDGMVAAEVTSDYANQIICDLKSNGIPLYVVIGNHDTNYFGGNLQPLSPYEQYLLYQRHSDSYVAREQNNLYYYKDFNDVSLRALFLTSFDNSEKVRYGFSNDLIEWVKRTLKTVPNGFSVIIFSHDAPLAELDYWSTEIRNGDRLMKILEEYNSVQGNNIMAYIHGHTHADFIYSKRSFPIVSIGCAKCEYFTDKKPEGSFTHYRKLNTAEQDLWDTLVISPSENKIDFIRFGAGSDRTVCCK